MTDLFELDLLAGEAEAKSIFEQEVGTSVATVRTDAGNKSFLKFVVGREAPIFSYALRETQKRLSPNNPFRGALGLAVQQTERFPESLEASALQTLLTRSTRAVSEGVALGGFSIPYVPFQNREDHKLAQPASHVIVGRRGVGKSTLIKRAAELIKRSQNLIGIVDVQTHALLQGEDLEREILFDCIEAIAEDLDRIPKEQKPAVNSTELRQIAGEITRGDLRPALAAPRIKRALAKITRTIGGHAYIFLDDFHLLNYEEQPRILHLVHSALKGANGWLKVAGLRSLLNYYSPRDRVGLQVPGDAQPILLDLTLENPEQAEAHLRAILKNFFDAIGYNTIGSILPAPAFRRLAWANAGVPRDFLQMLDRAIEHARRNRHSVVTLSDVNAGIGESGQRKMDELAEDARNNEGQLRETLSEIEKVCLEKKHTNGFLVRSSDSEIRQQVHVLSDLRLVHVINQSITPDRAGERYEAYIIDYSLFTGFRRRPGVEEMLPDAGQFKVEQLRRLPKITEAQLVAS